MQYPLPKPAAVLIPLLLLSPPVPSQVKVLLPPGSPPMLSFAAGEVTRAGKDLPEPLEIRVASRPGPAGSFRIRVQGNQVTVEAPGARGKMYGLLDAAEQIRFHGRIRPREESPFLKYRILKFNPPLGGNVYLCEEDARNSSWFFDLDYWDRFFSMMAYARYNAVSFWHSHPFGNMVRLKKYPEAAVLKGKAMDRAVAFWHALFKLAHRHGIDVYWVTWNIHVTPGFAKAHKIRKQGVDSPLVRDYMKECVRAVLREYPEIDGFGTCAGEAMGGLSQGKREDFIRECYLGPMKETGKKMTFLHRYWQASPGTVTEMLKKARPDGDVLLSLKFNGEHLYSSPRPHVKDKRWLDTAGRPYKLLWHLRNDDIYQFAWGDPEFASAVIRNCAGSAGFLMGSEVEVPGADRFHAPGAKWHKKWKYTFEKNWFRWMVWGRAGYDPDVGDGPFLDRFTFRYGKKRGTRVYKALVAASRIIPAVTSFHWNYMNGDWYPEGNIGGWNTSFEVPRWNYRSKGMWHGLEDYLFNNTIDDSLVGIPEFTARLAAGLPLPKGRPGPLETAKRLEAWAREAAETATLVRKEILSGTPGRGEETYRERLRKLGMEGLDCVLRDLRSLSLLGSFYAAQIRAATTLAERIFGAAEVTPEKCAALAGEAARRWAALAAVSDAHYAPHEIYLFGPFSWGKYLPDARKEAARARSLPAVPREEREWEVDGKRVKTIRWLHTGNRAKDGWIDFMNRIAGLVRPGKTGLVRTRVVVPPGRRVRLLFHGTGLDPSAPPGWRKEGEGTWSSMVEKTSTLTLHVRPEKAGRGFRLETRILGNPGDLLVFPALEGRAVPPFRAVPDAGSLHGRCLVLPKGVGHGKKGFSGPIIDNGWVDFSFRTKVSVTYRLWARVTFRDPDSNSFFVVLDGRLRGILADDTWRKWHWTALPGTLNIPPGKHLLRIRNREDGVKLDEVRLVPEGLDPKDFLPPSPAEKAQVFGPGRARKDLWAYFRLMTPIRPPSHTASLAEWERRRTWVREVVLRDIGLDPMPPRLPLDARIVSSLRRDGYTVNRLYFRILPGCYGSGWLYLPSRIRGRVPAILNPHGHWPGGAVHPVCQSRMIALAKKGYIALMTDSIHAADFETGMTPIGLMTLQNIRALDYLCSRKDVDPSRLGVTGASGGGQQTMYVMALDDRPVVAVPVVMACYFARILHPDWAHCWCNHAPGIAADTDMTEFLSVFAPKPALFISSSKDWTYRFPYEEYKQVRKVWSLYGKASNTSCIISNVPHGYGRPRREAMYRFMNARLGVEDPDGGKEPPLTVEDPAVLRKMERPIPGLRDWAAAAAWYRSTHRPALPPWKIPGALAALLRAAPPVPGRTGAVPKGTFGFPGGKARKLLIRGEKGIRIPALLLSSSREPAGPAPAVILLDPRGKAGVFRPDGTPDRLVKGLMDEGALVLALDARFTGELAVNWEKNCLAWGRPAAGMAADDARWAASWLAGRKWVDPTRIALLGRGKMGVAALLAAALEETRPKGRRLFSACAFEVRGWTYGNHPLHDMPGYYGGRKRLADLDLPVIPHILDVADLPGIAGALKIPYAVPDPGKVHFPGAAPFPAAPSAARALARFLARPPKKKKGA